MLKECIPTKFSNSKNYLEGKENVSCLHYLTNAFFCYKHTPSDRENLERDMMVCHAHIASCWQAWDYASRATPIAGKSCQKKKTYHNYHPF